MTSLPEHGWYDRQFDDACDFGDAIAERKWHPRGISRVKRAPSAIDNRAAGMWTGAFMDALIENRAYSLIRKAQPMLSLNAAFDEAVRQVRASERRAA